MLFIFMGKYYTFDDRGTEKVAVYIIKHVLHFLKGKQSFLDVHVSAYSRLFCVRSKPVTSILQRKDIFDESLMILLL